MEGKFRYMVGKKSSGTWWVGKVKEHDGEGKFRYMVGRAEVNKCLYVSMGGPKKIVCFYGGGMRGKGAKLFLFVPFTSIKRIHPPQTHSIYQ